MNRKQLIILLYAMGIVSACIAVYQFIDGRPFPAVLSVLFALCFILIGGVYNQKKIKKDS